MEGKSGIFVTFRRQSHFFLPTSRIFICRKHTNDQFCSGRLPLPAPTLAQLHKVEDDQPLNIENLDHTSSFNPWMRFHGGENPAKQTPNGTWRLPDSISASRKPLAGENPQDEVDHEEFRKGTQTRPTCARCAHNANIGLQISLDLGPSLRAYLTPSELKSSGSNNVSSLGRRRRSLKRKRGKVAFSSAMTLPRQRSGHGNS